MLGTQSYNPLVEQRVTETITMEPYLIAEAGPAGPPDKEQKLLTHCGEYTQRGRAYVSAIIVHN